MPRLLHINTALNTGSHGRICEQISMLAAQKGWESTIVHGARYVNKSQFDDIQVTERLDEIWHGIRSYLLDNHGLNSICQTKTLIKKIQQLQPDVIHLHNIHGYYLNYKVLFSFLAESKIPVVWTLHDCWAMTGHCTYFMRTNCKNWQTGCNHCPQKKTFPATYLFDRSKKNYALKKSLFTSLPVMHITTVSNWLKDIAVASYFNKYPVTVVPNGIKTDVLVPKTSAIKEQYGIQGKKLLLAVAIGLDERKGLYDYISLAERLPEQYQLMLVGLTEKEQKTLPKNVIGVKRINGAKELAAYYSAADALLSLSYEETFGMTIAEAMACGTPAIVYDNTAQPELITPETGLVVKSGDVEGVKNAIEEVCAKGKAAFSIACREHALEYDEKKCYQKYLDIYSKILNI